MKWFLGTVVLLVVGLIFRLELLVYAMYVLLGVLLLSRYLTRQWIGGIEVTRSCPQETAEIGDTVSVVLTIQNQSALPVPWLLVEDGLPAEALMQQPPGLRVHGSRVALMKLSSRAEKELRYELEMLRRGFYRIGPLLVETGDMFGLHRRYRVLTEPHYVLVYPKVVPLQGYDLASRRPLGEVRLTHRLFEDPTRISGVREYQEGDPLHRVHWRATARTGKLHSKTYEPSCIAGATLLLDFHQRSFPAPGEMYRAEMAVTAAASLAHAVDEMGQQLGLITNGRDAAERIRAESGRREFFNRVTARADVQSETANERLAPLVVETQRGAGQLMRIFETLARLEWAEAMTFAEMIAETSSRIPRDATVIAILSDVSEETALALGVLRRSGYAVTAIVVMFGEAALHDWAIAPEWAGRLLGEGIEVRLVTDEESLSRLCAEALVH